MANKNNSRTNFLLGLSTGVTAMALLGFFIVLGVYFTKNNNLPQAALPAGDNAQNNEPATQPDDNQDASDNTPVEGHSRGNPEASITIVEFSDFQCPYCDVFHPTLKQALSEYPNEVRWVYKHFPLDSIHPQAIPSAEASECAAEQGKFWEFTDILYENQSLLGESFYNQVASQLGLDMAQFENCVSSRKYQDKVKSDYQEGIVAGIRGTPGSLVNGVLVEGAVPYSNLKAAIESMLGQ